jgi:hypothetical protein
MSSTFGCYGLIQELSPAVNTFIATFHRQPLPLISSITAAINTAATNDFRYHHPNIFGTLANSSVLPRCQQLRLPSPPLATVQKLR